MTQLKAMQVPLVELLERVPHTARLQIDSPDGYGSRFIPVGRLCHEAADALRAAIEEAEKQEPVATVYDPYDTEGMEWHCEHPPKTFTKLYTRPAQWNGLTDDDIDRVTDQQWAVNNHKPIYAAHRAYARAIEALLREKNS